MSLGNQIINSKYVKLCILEKFCHSKIEGFSLCIPCYQFYELHIINSFSIYHFETNKYLFKLTSHETFVRPWLRDYSRVYHKRKETKTNPTNEGNREG